MESQSRPLLVTSEGLRLPDGPHSRTGAVPTEARVPVGEPALVVANGQTLHRRYTVTVYPDGTEIVNDIEEWVTDD